MKNVLISRLMIGIMISVIAVTLSACCSRPMTFSSVEVQTSAGEYFQIDSSNNCNSERFYQTIQTIFSVQKRLLSDSEQRVLAALIQDLSRLDLKCKVKDVLITKLE